MWLIFDFSKIAMLFRGVTVGPPRVHLGEVRGANNIQPYLIRRVTLCLSKTNPLSGIQDLDTTNL